MIAARVAGRADPGVLHRLAQLLLVDQLAGGLHRPQQRALGVAARRLGLLASAADLVDRGVLVLLELGQPLLAALVILAAAPARRSAVSP